MAQRGNSPSKRKQKVDVTIKEMLAAVRDVWFEVDGGRGMTELECEAVAFKLCAFQALPDHSTAQKYISNVIQANKKFLSWDDFNSIFSKGIFKEAIINKAQSLGSSAGLQDDGEKLGEKLSRSKRHNLQSQLREGAISTADQKVKLVRRPVLQTLGEIAKKSAPDGDFEPYDEFFNRMQGLVEEMIEDPCDLELDAFAKQLGFVPPVREKSKPVDKDYESEVPSSF